jgi:Zn-dependent protease with chaperone function
MTAAWALAKKRIIAIMSTAAITRRFVGTSALAMYAFSSLPLAAPTSDLSLSLAQGSDSVPLERSDPFAVNVRKIAARIGVKNPENLSVRVGEETSGASIGSNATIGFRGACIVLPLDLYDAFFATDELRRKFTGQIPSKEEVDFVLAHEAAHIARNHSIISATFLPLSVIASCSAIKRIPNKFVASIVSCVGLVAGNMLVSWRLEHEADHIAAESGFVHGGIHCFQRKLSHNCELRSLMNTRMITKEGNYLGDTAHPFLTSRIHHLKLIAQGTAAAHGHHTVDRNVHDSHSSCLYCMKM